MGAELRAVVTENFFFFFLFHFLLMRKAESLFTLTHMHNIYKHNFAMRVHVYYQYLNDSKYALLKIS